MRGFDIDGVLTAGYIPEPGDVVISGRTFNEYDDTVKAVAQICPVYVRGVGEYGDQLHAGWWKAIMIKLLGITEFYEDSPVQIEIIQRENPEVIIHQVGER